MKIKVGQMAPPFAATDIHGNPIRLEDYQGQWLLLCFNRLAACPFCGLHIYGLSLSYPALHERGLAIVAFIESSDANVMRQTYAQSAPFPIIADVEQQFYRFYGLGASRFGFWWGNLTRPKALAEAAHLGFGHGKVDGQPYRLPADFLIGPDSIVRYVHYGRDAGNSLPPTKIEALIDQFAVRQPARVEAS